MEAGFLAWKAGMTLMVSYIYSQCNMVVDQLSRTEVDPRKWMLRCFFFLDVVLAEAALVLSLVMSLAKAEPLMLL